MSVITGTRVDQVLHDAVEDGIVPNVVAMAADHHGTIYEGAAGSRAAGSAAPVTPDTMFRIASMTKPVTTVAALQQVERGNLELDTPVERYRPEFADLQVLDGWDGDTPRLRPPARKATVRQLITHTSGLGYWFWNDDLVRWEDATGVPNVLAGKAQALTAPLVADPGTRFEYGISTDWLGRVVETVTGESLDAYFAKEIFEPLGMEQTTFAPSDEQRADLAACHLRREGEPWAATRIDWVRDPEYWSGGHGLYSTPRDYLRFQRMLLDHGGQILDHGTVDAAFANHVGALDFPARLETADPGTSADFNVGPGFKWGLGLLLNTEQQPGMRAPFSGGWAGIQNTHFWVDHRTGITGAIYCQLLPFGAPGALQVYADFEKALYASIRFGG